MKRLSKTGLVFATLFAVFSLWRVILVVRGEWGATAIIFYVTLPFSLIVHYLCVALFSLIGMSYGALNWVEVALDIILGAIEAYFLGWLFGRPFRR